LLSRDIEKAKQFCKAYKRPFLYTYEALLIYDELDAVYIATPHTFHHAHVLLFLQKKKAFLCEKPTSVRLCKYPGDGGCSQQNKTFLMSYVVRFLPIIDKTLQLIKEGEIGELKT